MDNINLFEKLLKAEDETEVDELLKRAGYGLENESAWVPLGSMENNFSTVGNQQTEATAALVEKIINGIDAVLMAECYRRGIDPEGTGAPTSMSQTIEKFFDVRDGSIGGLDASSQTQLAKNIHVVAVGDKAAPCYLVVDKGEGQTPDAFPDTFLSLNKSNKLRIPFVQGKFNSGGTGVLQFCGTQNMQLIVSRRHPEAPVKSGDTSRQLWGFTIVRRMRPTAGRRNSMYVYFAPNGKVPRFEADQIKVLPEDRSTVAPRPYAVELAYGTCVKLYNFRWKAKSIATTDARYELERYLHSPCLPFRLTETRDYRANYFSTTIAGIWATIDSEETPSDSKVEAGFPAGGDLNLRSIGSLPYRLVVFREHIDKRHVPHGVFFAINGQVHGGLPADYIGRTLKFDYLRDHLLVSVDCTSMHPTVREDFFMASRDRVRKNDVYDEIVEHLTSELREHPGLRELNAARRKKRIEDAISDEKEVTSLFNELLKADPMLASLFGGGDRLVTTIGPGLTTPFTGKKFPTYFRLTKSPSGGLVKPCPINTTARIEFETDAANDYFKRADCPGVISTNPPNIIEHSHLWNGKFVAHFRVPWDAQVGDRIEVAVTVEDVETAKRGAPFVCRFALLAQPEADREPGKRGKSGDRAPQPSKKSAPSLAIPEVKEVHLGNPKASIEVRHDANGGHEYFLNLDNACLLTELKRAKESDQPLIKFWFKYGLLLCALGMLKEQKEQLEKPSSNGEEENDAEKLDGEDLQRINAYCNGLARVIVPIIRTLYRGPQVAAS